MQSCDVSLCFLEEVRQTSGKQGLLGHTVIEVVAYIRMQITNLIMNISLVPCLVLIPILFTGTGA